MARNLENLMKLVREEMRIEGPGGGGIADHFIQEQLNLAIANLAEIFPIRDTIDIITTPGKHTYDLGELIPEGSRVENIIKVTYDGRDIRGKSLDDYSKLVVKDEGAVSGWFLWGNTLTLIGEVKECDLILWIHRPPRALEDTTDIPETPYYADNALVNFAVSACYRERNDYDRASFHFNIFQHDRNMITNRGIPQKHRDHAIRVRDTYWGPEGRPQPRKTDNNPGGN